ncbi:MAG: sugar ABC transporter substrate-binding protein [Chloroflexota bacterium]|nr:sugar ABC transporter substrate-binding protein [Chloroflexota bacterium]
MMQRMPKVQLPSNPLSRRRLVGTAAVAAAAAGMHQVPVVGAQDGVEVTWTSWGNTGEVANLREFTEAFNASQSEIVAVYNPVPTDGYDARLLTTLNGGTAPDLFYVGDGQVSLLIENEVVADLTELLSSEASQSRPEQFAGDLWGPAETPDGRLYGVPVDCNPLVLWYNKTILQEAGFTDMPADIYEAGNWNWDTFQSMLDAVTETGKRGLVLADWWALRYSWVTNNGGAIYADGRFVANEDPLSMEAFQWLADNIAAEKILFSGSLPEGQGDDAMFMSGQLAFVSLGRWGLPLFRQNDNLDYDIVPYPTNTGNTIEPSGVAVAYWMMNAALSNPDQAFTFYTHFVSPDGQAARLDTGGNAVPSIEGVEEVVLSDDEPEHKQYFLDARDIGYGPLREEAGTPGLSTRINDLFSTLWLDGGDVQAALDEVATTANTMIEENAG